MNKEDLFKLADLLAEQYASLATVNYFDYHPRDGRYALIVTLPDGSRETIENWDDWGARYKPELDAWREWLNRQDPDIGMLPGGSLPS